jgi:hypothetical protein
MNYLGIISVLFDNLTGQSVGSSNRFYTKRKTRISQTNYNKGKRDITVKDSKTLSAFLKDFKNLKIK